MFLSYIGTKLSSFHSSNNQRPNEENEAPGRVSALFQSTVDLVVSSTVSTLPSIQRSAAQNITLIKLYGGAELIFSGTLSLASSGIPSTLKRLFSFGRAQEGSRNNYGLACRSIVSIGTGTYLISFGILELLGKIIISNNEIVSMELVDNYLNDETISYMQTSREINSFISENQRIEQLGRP